MFPYLTQCGSVICHQCNYFLSKIDFFLSKFISVNEQIMFIFPENLLGNLCVG